MSCCKFDVEKVVKIVGSVVSVSYIDHRVSPPVLMTQAAYDALVKVKCPETSVEHENVCLQVIGNTDASLIVGGYRNIVQTLTFDGAGVPTVSVDAVQLFLNDGTDVSATHEVVACPEAIVTTAKSCVA